MKTTARSRGPKGQFIKRPSSCNNLHTSPKSYALRLIVAGFVTVALALLLTRCHIVWSHGPILAPIELPRDLLTPLE